MPAAWHFGDIDYFTKEVLREESRETLVRATQRGPGGGTVLLKVLKLPPSVVRAGERVRKAYEAGRSLESPVVALPLAWHSRPGAHVLILEDDGSDPLERLVHMPLGLEAFLKLAVRLATLVADLHEQGWIHTNVKPSSILMQRSTQRLKFLDLEFGMPAGDENPIALGKLEGSLPYMSPEQTGRLNHALDFRSDLYSLGILLFQLRTGTLPFQASDPLGWVYRHLAQAVPPLSEASPGTPQMVSQIVLKLLAKTPEDRYQSALGLKLDLERCLELLQSKRPIDPFPLGVRDTSSRFWVPQRLYGRESQTGTLVRIFDDVVRTATPVLVSVAGYSGVGKSTLVHSLYKPLVRERGFFLEGKFDQNKRDIPYSTLSQAFGDVIRRRLSESPEEARKWRQRLQAALGTNGQLIIDLIPEAEILLGKQTPVPPMPLEEADRRLRLVFRRFLATFTRREHPLALFLDDLQWADPATLKLMEDVLSHPDSKYFMLILAYRDNEVGPSHPLSEMIETLRSAGTQIEYIAVDPLSKEHLVDLVADAVRRPKREVQPLAELIHERTAGNPFFTVQLLRALHQEGFILFNARSTSWQWDLDAIKARRFPQEVVDLTVQRIQNLPESTQSSLKVAACLGNSVWMSDLVNVLNQSEDELDEQLWDAVRAGVLSHVADGYRFVHDRLQQAVLTLIPAESRAPLHLLIGHKMLRAMPERQHVERVFDIVNQLNLGVPVMTDPQDRLHTAQLNLTAARKAKSAGAYGSALKHATHGINLLPKESCWSEHHRLTFALHLEKAQAEYLDKHFENAEASVKDLIGRCDTMVERAAAYSIGVQLNTTKGLVGQAVSLAIEYLALCQIEVPLHPTKEQVEEECRRTLEVMGGRSIEDLVNLPGVPDEETRAKVTVMALTLPAALFFDTNTWAIVTCHSVQSLVNQGNTDTSPVIFNSFAMVLGSQFGKYKEGYRFGKVGLDILQKRKLEAVKGSVYLMFGCLVSFWVKPLSTVIPYLEQSIQAATDAGDLTYACYSSTILVTAHLAKGSALGEIQHEAERRLEFVRHERFQQVANGLISAQLLIQYLRGYGDLDEAGHEREIQNGWPIEICLFYVRKLQGRFIMGRYAEALEAAERARPFVWSSPNLIQSSEYTFFHALALLQLDHPEGVGEHERLLTQWAENCPENFLARSALVCAERARLKGRDIEAARLYEQAIASARVNGTTPVEAIAFELAAKFYMRRGFDLIGRTYLGQARAAYLQWGAEAKVKALDAEYPPSSQIPPPAPAHEATVTLHASELDLQSVSKASQTISREIQMDELSKTLLSVLMEQAGADRGCLVFRNLAHLTLRAVASLEDTGLRVDLLPDIPLEGSGRAPEQILLRALRTGKPVIVDGENLKDSELANDEYIRQHHPRSMVCLPISRGKEISALLYIENALVPEAFDSGRVTVLGILASQAAISLQNAQLLSQEQLARKVAEQSQRREAVLAETGKLLTESLDWQSIIDKMSGFFVKEFGDWCHFDIVEDGKVCRYSGAHRDPEKAALLAQLEEKYPAGWTSAHPSARVLRGGEPLLFASITGAELRRYTENQEHFDLIRRLGTRSAVIVPMRSGPTLFGAMTVASKQAGRYGRMELDLMKELGDRIAIALERARLYRKARKAIELRDEFLSIASHELKTPLTPLQLQADSLKRRLPILLSGSDLDWVNERLEMLLRQVRRMARLINELLDISRFTAGKLRLELKSVDLSSVVHDVVRSLREQEKIDKAGSKVIVTAEEPVVGRWDRLRLEQVVANLLSNAVKFGEGRPIEIHVEEHEMEATLLVRDHGIGIVPEARERVFGRFERAVSQRHFGGLGLGLYIVRQITEALGGTITVESEPNVGSTFVVKLPLSGPVPMQTFPGVHEEPGPVHMH